MIRPLIPLSYSEEEVITLVYAGYDYAQIGTMVGKRAKSVDRIVRRAGAKIGGPTWAPARIRCLIWKAMEVGVLQYLGGVRGEDGRLLAPPPKAQPVLITPT